MIVHDRVKVLYLGAQERSGSTILSQVLGEIPGIMAVGQLAASIWTYGFAQNLRCGCGYEFRNCPFWRDVIQLAFGGFDKVDSKQLLYLWRQVPRFYYIPFMSSRWKPRFYREPFVAFSDYMSKLFVAVQQVSRCEWIVDSSKSPTYAFLLNTLPNIDLRVLHLVRDSRAVAYSLLRQKIRPEFNNQLVYMDQKKPFMSAIRWISHNSVLSTLAQELGYYARVSYEVFVANPTGTVQQLGRRLKFDSLPQTPFDANEIQLSSNHQIMGNPIRFVQGQVELQEDDEWKTKMKSVDKWMVTALTWPLLMKYGYIRPVIPKLKWPSVPQDT